MRKEQYNWKKIFREWKSGKTISELSKKYNIKESNITHSLSKINIGTKIFVADNFEDDQLLLIANREQRVKIAQRKATLLNTQNNKEKNKEALRDIIMNKLLDVKPIQLNEINPSESIKTSTEAIFSLGDFHITEKNNLNDLIWFKKVISNVVEEAKKYKSIIINLGGDYIEGALRGDQISKGYNPVLQATYALSVIRDLIYSVSKHTTITQVNIVDGNHDRITFNKNNNPFDHTYTLFIVEGLKEQFPKLHIKYDSYAVEYNFKGKSCLLIHGDYSGGANNTENWIKKREGQRNKFYDLTHCNHCHISSLYDRKGSDKKIIFVPSIANKYNNYNEFEDRTNNLSTIGWNVIVLEKNELIFKHKKVI